MNGKRCPVCTKEVSPHNNLVSLEGTLVHLTCFFVGVPSTRTKEDHDIAVDRRVAEIINFHRGG